MFDSVRFDKRALAVTARILRRATGRYGVEELARLNHAFRIMRGEIEREPPAHPWQRPEFYVPGIPVKIWYDATDVPEMTVFEGAYETIKRELSNVLRARGGFDIPPAPIDQGVVQSGSWDLFWIKDGCKRFEANWDLCPETKRLIDSMPRVGESVTFAALQPGTVIKPHTGVANLRLTLHLPLVIPEGCELWVMEEKREWVEGKCLVFNDSILHWTRNNSTKTRYILLVDMWHPDLSSIEIAVLEELLHRLDPDESTANGHPA
ncbi:MAG TPA: aspartyl/asparaginyl beta-hydroxylase domain-containing protein [Pyrinomonadaceae bacterium]|jgi:aspartyl/asparaginyl beta-hydroxylase (cupin superfamily)